MLDVAKRKPPPTPEQIKAVRKALGLTQEAAAEKVGVTRRQWAAWEGGERRPSGPAAILIRQLAAKKSQ